MKVCKLLLAVIGATVLLGALVSSASARNFQIDVVSHRATFREVRFILPGSTTTCEVIIEGSVHNLTMTKVIGSLIGHITRASISTCATGTAVIQGESLPWHVRYSGFQGPLPNINSFITHLIDVGWRIREAGGINCLARSSAAEPVIATHHRDESNHLTVGLSGTIRSGIECLGIRVTVASDSPPVLRRAGSTSISLRLI